MSDSDRGAIFNIQGYSIHDGPGIRTTVFLKGCPLRCLWCQNPESQIPFPEIFFSAEKCAGCAKCVQACPERAILLSGNVSRTNRRLCRGSGTCTEVCPNEARALIGRWATVDEIFQTVAADSIFYRESGGGVTLSGGEPLAQPEFAAEILIRCKEARIHTTLDTCGYASREIIKYVVCHADLVLYDFKHMDPEIHKKYTGVSNNLILENARGIHHELSIPMQARLALIPGFNDSPDNIEAMAKFITADLSSDIPVHILPYHRFGEGKWKRLDRESETMAFEAPSEERIEACRRIFESFGLKAVVGG
jgi:pyruvate formate lyase activating enzyme